MAIFKPGIGMATISGKIGGTVFSHNRGGAYVRNLSIPTNPQTSYQTQIRTYLQQQSQAWAALTAVQQAAWKAWALQNPVTNALGEPVTLTGHQAYIQIGHRLLQAGNGVITLPPVVPAPSALKTLSAVADASDSSVTLTFTDTPVGANNKAWVWAAVVDSAGITNVSNLWKLVAISAANQATAYDVGSAIETRFGDLIEDQVVHLKVAVFDTATGLLSMARYCSTVVVA